MKNTLLGVLAALSIGAVGVAGCLNESSTGNAGTGGQCRVSDDCAGGQVCVSGVCIMEGVAMKGGACVSTLDCGPGLYCSSFMTCATGGTQVAGGSCTTDGQCAPPLRCNLDGFFGTCGPAGTTNVGGACQQGQDCLAGLVCAGDMTCQSPGTAYPPFAGVTCADDVVFRPYFEVPRPGKPPADFYRLPFPNDVRVTGGQLDMSDFPRPGPTPLGIDLVQLYVDSWVADFDGFSSIAVATFRFSAPVDFDTATPDAIIYVDVTPGAATLGNQLGRSWTFNPGRNKYLCNNGFMVRSPLDFPLLPRHTYAVILTTALHSTTGIAATPDADLVALLGATRPAVDAALGHGWDVYQPLRDWVQSQGAAAPAIAAATVFTVQDTTGHMQRVAASVAAQPPPVLSALTLCDTGVTSPCDDGTPARACAAADPRFFEIHGRVSMPIYQSGTEPYDTPEQGGGIVEVAGVPQLARTEQVCFALTIPKGAGAVMPAAGWPLMVHHHGTGGSMRSIVTDGLSAEMAAGAHPSAVLGFDAVEHGARRGASTESPDNLVFNPLSPRASRDNLLQGASDILQALRVAGVTIAAAASPTGAAIAFNPAAVTFLGHSQGSTSGELALGFSDAAPAVVFSGAGSFLTSSLLDKSSPVDIGAGLAYLIGEPLDGQHPVMTLFQSYFDRSDPLNYNPLLVTRPPSPLPSKHVFMSWGTGDTYTPRSTLEANARSLGVPPVAPLLEDFGIPGIARPVSLDVTGGDGAKRTAAVFQYAPGGYDGHFVAEQNPAAIADWTAFLQSYLSTGTPTVP